jgi:hypothetical protein
MHHQRDEAFAVPLLDQVEEYCTENHKFERNWLEAKHKTQAEAITRIPLHKPRMRQHRWKSLDIRVGAKEIKKLSTDHT